MAHEAAGILYRCIGGPQRAACLLPAGPWQLIVSLAQFLHLPIHAGQIICQTCVQADPFESVKHSQCAPGIGEPVHQFIDIDAPCAIPGLRP